MVEELASELAQLECGMVQGPRLGFDKILLLHRFVQIYGICGICGGI